MAWIALRSTLFTASPSMYLAQSFAATRPKDTVEERVSTETVVAMHTTSNLTCSVQAWDDLILGVEHTRRFIDSQASHAIVDDRRDDGHIKRFCSYCRAWDDIMVELLA